MSELALRILFAVVAAPLALCDRARGGRAARGTARGRVRARRVGVLPHRARDRASTRSMTSGSRSRGCFRSSVHARFLGLVQPCGRRLAALIVAARHPRADDLAARRRQAAARRGRGDRCFGIAYTAGMLALRLRASAITSTCAATTRSARVASLGPMTFRSRPAACCSIFPLVLTWASDIGAYAVGRTIGEAQADSLGQPGKDGRRGRRRPRGEHGGRRWLYRALRARTRRPVSASRHGELLGSERSSASPRRSAISLESLLKREGGREGQLAHHSRARRDSRPLRQPDLFVLPVAYLLLGLAA